MMRIHFVLIVLLPALGCFAQQEFPLYSGSIPNSRNAKNEETRRPDPVVDTVVSKVSEPTLTVYQPKPNKNNRVAVIICPGGGYGVLCIKMEGEKIARAFNKSGITAFVLKYRLPDNRVMPDPSIGPLQDAQQAIKLVRERASVWNIDQNKIGIMGFSAGGHLAATAGTHFDSSFIQNPFKTSLRPDFMVLVYPVISFSDSIGHIGSRNNLIGLSPTAEKIRFFSNELHINKNTPPVFLTLPGDDVVVNPTNSLVFLRALQNIKIPSSLHMYSKGGHGYLKTPPFEEWFGRVLYWIKEMNYVSTLSNY